MNFVVILYFVALAANVVSSTNEGSSTVKGSLLDILKSRERFGYSKFKDQNNARPGPSASDTLDLENQQLDLCGPILCITANLTKGAINGLSQYDVLNLGFNSDGARVIIDIDIIFPTLQLDVEYYEMKGNIMEALPLAGKGKLYFETTDFRFWTRIISQISDSITIENFENSGFSIKNILSHTEYDGNIDDIFNAMVEELLPEWLNRFNKAIAARCGILLKEVLNPIPI